MDINKITPRMIDQSDTQKPVLIGPFARIKTSNTTTNSDANNQQDRADLSAFDIDSFLQEDEKMKYMRKSFEYGYSFIRRDLFPGFGGLAEDVVPDDFIRAMYHSIRNQDQIRGTEELTKFVDALEKSLEEAQVYIAHAREYINRLPEPTKPSQKSSREWLE